MAENETQGQEDATLWGFDDFGDSSLPSATFDEPLIWPEAPTWDAPATTGPEGESLHLPEQTGLAAPAEFDDIVIFPPEPDPAVVEPAPLPDLEVQWQATDDDPVVTALPRDPLAGLGGGTNGVAPATTAEADVEPGESIWADPPPDSGDIGLISTSVHSKAPVYPATESSADRPLWRRVDVRSGNAAIIGLISLVSLVLLGMFLSVRARNEVPTDSSQTRRPSNDVAATGPVSTVPLTTTVTTVAPAPAINIADLLPPPGDAAASAATESTTGSAGARSPATTSAAARTSGGGGGGGGATTPATSGSPAPTSPPATSPPVQDTTPPPTSPPPTSPPVDDPPTTSPPPRRTTTTFTMPTFPTTPTTGGNNTSPFPFPTFPGIND